MPRAPATTGVSAAGPAAAQQKQKQKQQQQQKQQQEQQEQQQQPSAAGGLTPTAAANPPASWAGVVAAADAGGPPTAARTAASDAAGPAPMDVEQPPATLPAARPQAQRPAPMQVDVPQADALMSERGACAGPAPAGGTAGKKKRSKKRAQPDQPAAQPVQLAAQSQREDAPPADTRMSERDAGDGQPPASGAARQRMPAQPRDQQRDQPMQPADEEPQSPVQAAAPERPTPLRPRPPPPDMALAPNSGHHDRALPGPPFLNRPAPPQPEPGPQQHQQGPGSDSDDYGRDFPPLARPALPGPRLPGPPLPEAAFASCLAVFMDKLNSLEGAEWLAAAANGGNGAALRRLAEVPAKKNDKSPLSGALADELQDAFSDEPPFHAPESRSILIGMLRTSFPDLWAANRDAATAGALPGQWRVCLHKAASRAVELCQCMSQHALAPSVRTRAATRGNPPNLPDPPPPSAFAPGPSPRAAGGQRAPRRAGRR